MHHVFMYKQSTTSTQKLEHRWDCERKLQNDLPEGYLAVEGKVPTECSLIKLNPRDWDSWDRYVLKSNSLM